MNPRTVFISKEYRIYPSLNIKKFSSRLVCFGLLISFFVLSWSKSLQPNFLIQVLMCEKLSYSVIPWLLLASSNKYINATQLSYFPSINQSIIKIKKHQLSPISWLLSLQVFQINWLIGQYFCCFVVRTCTGTACSRQIYCSSIQFTKIKIQNKRLHPPIFF